MISDIRNRAFRTVLADRRKPAESSYKPLRSVKVT